MANYIEMARTNYFRVIDEKRYKELFDKLISEDEVYDFTKVDENGAIWHAFGSYGYIDYQVTEDDYDRDEFFKEMQKILPDDEALIFMAAGHEKLRYIIGFSLIVTNKDIQYINTIDNAIDTARVMLQNPGWTTVPDY